MLPVLGLMLLVGGVYAALTWQHRGPIVFADEPGYLGNARWLVGAPRWWMGKAASIQIGYSLLIAPVFVLVHSPVNIYRAVILVNCTMCALLAGALYLLARWITRCSRTVAVASGAVACAYPAIAVQSGIAWAEITAMLGLAVFVLTAWRVFRSPGYGSMLSNAAIVVFLSLVHDRFIALPLLCAVLLVYVAAIRVDLRVSALSSIAFLVIAWFLSQALQSAVHRARWDPGTPISSVTFQRVLQTIPAALLRSLAGEMWYLLVGTAGLVLLGVAALTSGFLRPTTADLGVSVRRVLPAKLMLLYVLAAMGSVVVVSAVFTATGFAAGTTPPRLDYAVYGRYVDPVAPTLIALAVAVLLVRLPRRGSRKILLLSGLATLGVGMTLLVFERSHRLDRSVNPARSPGIFALVADAHGHIYTSSASTLLITVSLGMTALILMLAWLACVQPKVAVTGVAFFFLVVGGFDLTAIGPTEMTVAHDIAFDQKLGSLRTKVVAYDLDDTTTLGYYGLPFWLNKSEFVGFHATSAQWPDAQVFVGPPSWSPAVARGLHLFGVDPLSGQGVWVK